MDFNEYDEAIESTRINVQLHGEYLCVEVPDAPLHVYRQVTDTTQAHSFTSRTMHNGQMYALVWIDTADE